MASELEDFLRRAAQRRAENAAARAERPQPPRRPEYTDRNRERVTTSSDPDDEIVVADLVPTQAGPTPPVDERQRRGTPSADESADAIRRKLQTVLNKPDTSPSGLTQSNVGQSGSGLGGGGLGGSGLGGAGLGGSSLGNLGQGPGLLGDMARSGDKAASAPSGSPPLQALLRLMKEPDGIDQAILAREILDRPTHRWE